MPRLEARRVKSGGDGVLGEGQPNQLVGMCRT